MNSPTIPVEAERACSVPRNDVYNQAMQPKPRQVEWAVDQAVRGVLNIQRPANWKNLGMPAYTPQGLFPAVGLSGGGHVPAQIYLGIIAQESNMWQAPGSVTPGVTGNPLIGNYYGLKVYDEDRANDWDIDFTAADCGYGVAQVTDGMRLAGREKVPGEQTLPYDAQRAVALDFAANVAAGLRILESKWNETRDAGLKINDGNPARIENWFYAVWAYNGGLNPQSSAGLNNGAWGVRWNNNPAYPKFPANRAPFLERSYSDASDPQEWPYAEKVMGWAGHPVEILESPGELVAGYRPAWWSGDATTGPANRAAVKPPVLQFCDHTNSCVPGGVFTPDEPGVLGERAGPCAHKNALGQYDLKCWAHAPSTWKPDCRSTCGHELLRFGEGYPYQDDGTAYPPNCDLGGLPLGALVIDDQADAAPIVRPGCARVFRNEGSFELRFAADGSGRFPSKTDFHQLGAGFGAHFWYAHTRKEQVRGGSMNVTGTWTLNRELAQWARVFVHMPDHGAHTQQARYEIDLGSSRRVRVLLQRTQRNQWVSLGSFQFSGTPRVRLSSTTYDGDDDGALDNLIENEDIAYDAVAIQPLAAKPQHTVVSLGDSYSSGEAGSVEDGSDYYPETDNNGSDPAAQNACHRSRHSWVRKAEMAGTGGTIGALSDAWATSVEHHLLACAGAETENLLPYHTVPEGVDQPKNAWGESGTGQYGELSQLDKGFLDTDTTLVTLSIGGNDARFTDVVSECIVWAGVLNCFGAKLPGSDLEARDEIPNLIAVQVEDSIVSVLGEIRVRAPNARVMLMGYPRLFERNGNCVPLINNDEAAWMNDMSDLLAIHMKQAVGRANAKAGKTYVWFSDPRDEFEGVAVCGEPEHVNGMIQPAQRTAGEAKTLVLVSQQSFHPKIVGYLDYARSANATMREMGL